VAELTPALHQHIEGAGEFWQGSVNGVYVACLTRDADVVLYPRGVVTRKSSAPSLSTAMAGSTRSATGAGDQRRHAVDHPACPLTSSQGRFRIVGELSSQAERPTNYNRPGRAPPRNPR
jgi:hypothetical protein